MVAIGRTDVHYARAAKHFVPELNVGTVHIILNEEKYTLSMMYT